jgi:hypothetical protein
MAAAQVRKGRGARRGGSGAREGGRAARVVEVVMTNAGLPEVVSAAAQRESARS